jgi:hypothetical protein
MVRMRAPAGHEQTSTSHRIGLPAALALLAIAVMVNTTRYLGTATLGVFWAVTVTYTVGMIGYGERRSGGRYGRADIARRVTLPLLSAGAAVGVLAWTVATWGRTWTAIAAALAAGLVVHVVFEVRALLRP